MENINGGDICRASGKTTLVRSVAPQGAVLHKRGWFIVKISRNLLE